MDGSSRQVIIAANWKMYKTRDEAEEFCRHFLPAVAHKKAEAIIFPPSILLPAVGECLAGSDIKFGIQNIHWEKEGAYTGEISARMAADAGCSYCLCGHSERRHYFEESSEMVARKIQAALSNGLKPICCIGEILEERDNGETREVLRSQLLSSLSAVSHLTEDIIIAYEPVWAIGTGIVASPKDAEEAISYIRSVLAESWGNIADKISILYGGSVKSDNIEALMSCPNIDGALVGGASLKPDSFATLVNFDL
ncbi:MAG: triose-phosphate isomerase [Clostridiales bacterium]